jgi:hypothetical protein
MNHRSDTEQLPIIRAGQGDTQEDIDAEVAASAIVLLALVLFIAGCVLVRCCP